MVRVLRLKDGQPLTRDERELVLRFAFIIAIPLATILTLALLAVFFYGRHQLHDQITQNEVAIAQTNRVSKELNQ